ncbi:hypothetical protein A8C56_12955 [Niabella ginsenosidivorans]|uniref:Knr4/Smi1-like domain-containing protein n=1 Tax=Niabella ginsenosidivorans TaxID=1176587 RepID=A0A1A9I4Z3_9BACT|nr:hypothetical protein [Niabella ginsenosidivorans]ANH81770.1 hypothetical protein A8C56_12955 [Niabella ginsenosidivorans]
MGNELLNKYNSGQEKSVWQEIGKLTFIELDDNKQTEIKEILSQTISLTRINIELIIQKIQTDNRFTLRNASDLTPSTDIKKLVNIVKPFGFLPLSFLELYKYIKNVSLILDTGFQKKYPYSDPIYIESISNILEICGDGSWQEDMEENEEEALPVYLYFSPDYYHKDGVSGGEPYGIEISKTQKVDGTVFNTPYGEIPFIEYLRICFDHVGFPGIDKTENPFKDVAAELNHI